MSKIYVGDVGTIIRLNTNPDQIEGLEIATASTLKILVLKPDGSLKEWAATQYIDPDNGPTDKIEYMTADGDIDIKGTYKCQSFVGWDTPESGHKGQTVTFQVFEAFK